MYHWHNSSVTLYADLLSKAATTGSLSLLSVWFVYHLMTRLVNSILMLATVYDKSNPQHWTIVKPVCILTSRAWRLGGEVIQDVPRCSVNDNNSWAVFSCLVPCGVTVTVINWFLPVRITRDLEKEPSRWLELTQYIVMEQNLET